MVASFATEEQAPSRAARDLSREQLAEIAKADAEDAIAYAIGRALNEDGRSLRKIAAAIGFDPGNLSRLASGKDCNVSTLARIAVALGKDLHITIE
ncbi:XRE family transcriptional regulator [Pelagerythrobacter marensis]|uniref:HTH cro/C1-type domain-containing protein n=1 Tax=Pelagerythrobacter marensis TaxID=543877 RepID=A0A0G3X5I7_9SPHN|nr:XRE family transcriptional regulator [Pelagerythrobacter marensis]AKM06780.1 hypothetical protein AM2010_697 [Pelagerythrobacter marensis]